MKLEKKLDKKKKTKSIQRKDKHISKSINETWDRIFITIIIFYGKKERKKERKKKNHYHNIRWIHVD